MPQSDGETVLYDSSIIRMDFVLLESAYVPYWARSIQLVALFAHLTAAAIPAKAQSAFAMLPDMNDHQASTVSAQLRSSTLLYAGSSHTYTTSVLCQ
eukprot:6179876-Pleurochrysis_carterae.AAC.7